jgi:phosphatidylethanolamine/phosphatidyl-N-methylethanolamine N-methyltransferase
MKKLVPRDYSLIAPIYDKIFIRPLSQGHKELGHLLKTKTRKTPLKVLEVGVGSGLTFDHLPSRIQYTGIDINDRMLGLAQKKILKIGRKDMTLSRMNAQKMSFKENSYDVVMASSVLSAVDSPLKAMKEMIRVTKKGGTIAVIANVREERSIKSQFIKLFDPMTKKFLGFRTDIELKTFTRFKELELVECKKINNVFGFPLSTFLLFRKIK